MESFLGVFVSLLNRPAVPWLLAVGIVFFALGAAVVFAQRINALQRAIEPAIGDLRDIPVPDFVDRYEAFNQRVEDNETLGHGWKKFSESLILPHDEKGEPIRATERPEAYFGETCLIASRLNLRLWQSVPNILVGMGLLFTFVGLIAALYFASEGVAAKDIAKTQESLGNLLHAATFKFVTSVAGLFSSLVFSWWEKHCLHRVQKVLDEFCRLLEERVVFTTPEQLAYEQIRETRKQTLQFERFNADFAVSIASNISEALDKCFAERLQHALDGLIQEIKALGERLGKIGEEGMRQLLDGFLKELKGGAGAEMNSLKVTLAELDANLRKTAEAIEKSGGIFSRQVEIGAQPLESATARFKESVEKLDDIVKEAQSSGQTMLEVRDELKNTSDSLESAADPLREAARNLREAADKVSAEKIGSQEVADELRNSIQQIKAISGMLGGLINNIGELIKKGRESIDETGKTLTQGVKEATGNIATRLDETSKKLAGGIDKFDSAVKELQTVIDSAGNVGKQMLEVHENLSQSSKQFKAASSSVDTSLKKLNETLSSVQNLSTALNGQSKIAERGIESLKTLVDNLNDSEKTIKSTWEQYRSRFEKVDEDAGKIFGEINSGIDNYTQKIKGFTEKLTNHFGSALGTLSAVIEELQETAKELKLELEKLRQERERGTR